MFDASALVRSVIEPRSEARSWVARIGAGIEGFVPDLAYAEVAHALLRYVRGRIMTLQAAREATANVAMLPLERVALGGLATAALETAVAHELSVYDGFYLLLAVREDAILVTADRRLAAAYDRSELVT